jgi:hypothetical protein
MVTVNLPDTSRQDAIPQKLQGAADHKFQVPESPLIASTTRVSNDDRQRVDADMIHLRTSQGAPEQIPPVAATEIYDHRRLPAE